MKGIFSKIVARKIDAYIVAEDNEHLAFLDIAPLTQGHVLVIPKKEIDYIFDIESLEYLELWKFAQKVAKGMKRVLSCERIAVAVIGLDVPHAHIHLVPINGVSDINFEREKLSISKIEMNKIAKLIQSAI